MKVLVRTYSAGVHFGELEKQTGKVVVLKNSRRIWRWRGANTLSEVALSGIEHSRKGWSRVSSELPSQCLTEAIEIIPMTDAAYESCASCGWAE